MTTERSRPGLQAGERDMLTGWLDFHREVLLWKCEGLTDEQLKRRSVPPSALSLLGLVRHMAEVERGWFRAVLLGEDVPDIYDRRDDSDVDFNGVDAADTAADFATFKAECDAARMAVAQAQDLDVLSVEASQRTGEKYSLRWILTHMIEEYARHNGHADMLRESIDGSAGDY
ncbi:MAG TPA: DinB family protein [Streptosporangiaceae bacterium]|nr:DinB family protein [Streptosporangiaceae bacterium]